MKISSRLKILSLSLLLSICVFANQGQTGSALTSNEELRKILPQDDQVVNEQCSWKCRKVNSGYNTQITGFDFANGITFCNIYEQTNLDEPLRYNADRKNLGCVKDIFTGMENNSNYNKLKSLMEVNGNNVESKISYIPNDSKITMSKFLTSLVTLNPDIIDRNKTNLTGELTLKDGIENFSFREVETLGWWDEKFTKGSNYFKEMSNNYLGTSFEVQPLINGNEVYRKTTALDGFNKSNMAYFSDLFMNMEQVYQHLQILLFVVVGGYFLTSIGASKLQVYLENRGESASNQPYLHKFYIPMLMVGTFFMPIPEAEGKAHSTIVQNTIRYFTIEATNIADMASAIGGKTYMDKIYKSVGGINLTGIEILVKERELKSYIEQKADNIYKNTCSIRYDKPVTVQSPTYFLKMSEKEKQDFLETTKKDRQKVAGTEYDISLEACLELEKQINDAKIDKEALDNRLNAIAKFYENKVLQNKIKSLDSVFAQREQQLGWVNSLIVPSSGILIDTMQYITNEAMPKPDMKSSSQQNQKNIEIAVEKRENVAVEGEGMLNKGVGFLTGNLVWMSLPGAGAIKDFIHSNISIVENAIKTLLVLGSNPFTIGGAIILEVLLAATSAVGTLLSYAGAIFIIKSAFAYVPILVCSTAGIIAFVSYLVSLCKYFYISPFVVVFSLATKRMDKIVEFLISGISIFFKPILIVLFIYLALFIHTLISEVFLFISLEQFFGIELSAGDFFVSMLLGAITGMLEVFSALACSYIMWKLIVSGPGWALSLVGVDGKHDDMIAQGIEANLAKKAFVA